MGLSNLEESMLARGYVSARMAAAKLERHPATVHLMLRTAKGELETVTHGQQTFVSIASLTRKVGKEVAALFDMRDWAGIGKKLDELRDEERSGFVYPEKTKKKRRAG